MQHLKLVAASPIRRGDAFAIVKFDEKCPMVVPTFDAAKKVVCQRLGARAPQHVITALIDELAAQTMIKQ
ncbi:hypothetical protein [Burkholderia seminalis]|uniref:hypothetical protein n=1 Tax=Burkholderia seminalis TaxID=488731 RepID=UPI00084F4838|nr:hypothetical protein [Burkholderia seminalis]